MGDAEDLLAALRLAGMEPTDEDLPLLQLVRGAYEPAVKALLADEVRALPLEPDLDASRAPR